MFLHTNEYMEKDVAGYKKAAVLAGFCDHVFRKNADAYIREGEFLDGPKLATTWASWWGARKSGFKPQNRENNDRGYQNSKETYKKGSDNRQADLRNVPFLSKVVSAASICRRYATKSCKYDNSKCVIQTKAGLRRLYHFCSHTEKDPATGKETLCGKKHAKCDHK